MFPRLRQQLLAHFDLVVELSTLGEYGLDEQGKAMPLDPDPATARLAPRLRDRCGETARSQACANAGRGAPARP